MPKTTFLNLPKEKRERVVRAALEEFSSVDYSKATIDRIVERAGIPKGSFYQYFSDKDDLYEYAFSRIGDDKAAAIGGALDDAGAVAFPELVFSMIARGAAYEASMAEFAGLKQKFLRQCPQDLKQRILRNETPKSYRLLEEAMRRYAAKGDIRSDADLGMASFAISSCLMNLELLEGFEPSNIKSAVERMVLLILEGIGSRK
ncbi:MAG: TetR/AcrR family transcriptional regulator [Spirochaetes bacterium]|nr:TetR/AcrR family transcriptional regulator [Spirochaetota bacterium]MBU1080149.1 TetR/AcrR family transcriptional regulator [Spirochaetota bacterium]